MNINVGSGDKPLSKYELSILPIIERGISHHIGEESIISAKEISHTLKEKGCKVSETQISRILSHIRTHGIVKHLIATSKGYYVAKNAKEMEDYIESLRSREISLRKMRLSLEMQLTDMQENSPAE